MKKTHKLPTARQLRLACNETTKLYLALRELFNEVSRLEKAHQKKRLMIHPVTKDLLHDRLTDAMRSLPLGSLDAITEATERLSWLPRGKR